MTTPSSQQQLLLVLFILSAGAAEAQQPPMARPGCRDMCGNISIPFPFGIGAGCFLEGFEVLCNHSRAFLADKESTIQESGYFNDSMEPVYKHVSPVELVSISVGTGEARAYAPFSYISRTEGATALGLNTTSNSTDQVISLIGRPFAVSMTSNVLIAVGDRAEARLSYDQLKEPVSCRSYHDYYSGSTNGSCTGVDCCTQHAPTEIGSSHFVVYYVLDYEGQLDSPGDETIQDRWNYGMLVEKSGGYVFSTDDMNGNMSLLKRLPQGVPFVLDFAAGNTLCPAEGERPPPDYACVSGNSSCANTTSNTGFAASVGYFCKCLKHYDGNPYLPNGCQDIDECKQPQVYPCSNGGICKNRLEGYDCPCKSGMKDDGKGGPCSDVFTPAAKATVGAIGGFLLLAILSFLAIIHKEKKKTKEFYKKNGGPRLEKANVIKLFKKGELKHILKSGNLIGKGFFGEVYKGPLGNRIVAVKKPINAPAEKKEKKKPINGAVEESDQFANEVIIQSQVIHKNIVRLIGCCLEVDAPMLVYEFISQGSLHDILHENNKVALNLRARVSIAAQSADGLAYMHSKANTRILHGDVKPANILLDDNFVPKISDFGISRLLARDKEFTKSIAGDKNYMDPVYRQEGLLTEKSDVYSFGVVILELISRRRAIHSENSSLVKSFLEAHKKQEKAAELFDKEIAVTENLEILDILARMAVECLSLDVDQRPAMMEIAERLLILSRSPMV